MSSQNRVSYPPPTVLLPSSYPPPTLPYPPPTLPYPPPTLPYPPPTLPSTIRPLNAEGAVAVILRVANTKLAVKRSVAYPSVMNTAPVVYNDSECVRIRENAHTERKTKTLRLVFCSIDTNISKRHRR